MNPFILMIILFGTVTPSVSDNPLIGTWVYHEKWEIFSSAETDRPATYATPGAIIRFCSDGSFILESGYLYKQGNLVAIGVSDGLKLFTGKWYLQGKTVVVKYRLKSYELPWNGAKKALEKEIIEELILSKEGMKFRYFPFPDIEHNSTLLFIKETDLDFKVESDHMSCNSDKK